MYRAFFQKTKNFKFEMSSTVVRPAARVNISLIFFRKIEEVTLIDMSSFKIEYDRFHTCESLISIQECRKRFFDM